MTSSLLLHEDYFRFTPETRECVQRLVNHFSSQARPDNSVNPNPSDGLIQPKLAAVLVLLFEEHNQLRVLLTTRAKSLRTHGGQTSLPGGKWDRTDKNLIETAYREANEEVSLPVPCSYLHTIGLLEPHPFHNLKVTPVIAISTRSDLIGLLRPNEGEVEHIFSYSLESILNPNLAKDEDLVPQGSDHWPFETQYHNAKDYVFPKQGNLKYRLHCFQTSASPITGLTADILIRTAEIAYGRETGYERYAPGQLRVC